MILGINKTPKTKRNNGAIITKNDSGVILSYDDFFKYKKNFLINE
tara:strand:+ start:795 stop:929 length:135 start_codon:yes stop_codon:yes gene_type:complete